MLKKEMYREQFNSLDFNDENYIDEFVKLIYKTLMERDAFVQNSDNDNKRAEFYDLLKNVITELRTDKEQIQFISSGHSSLAFKINDKVIKVGKDRYDTSKFKKDFSCAVPLFLDESYKIDEHEYYTLQVTPYVNTLGVSKEDTYKAYSNLRKLGYIWNDPTMDNVGRIIEDFDYEDRHYKRGDLVILDLEDIAYVGEETTDDILEEIAMMSYNRDVYSFEMRYIEENKGKKR